MKRVEREIRKVKKEDRVLLLPHCLRPSETCPGKMRRDGMECPPDCGEKCVLKTLREEAIRLGYKGVCIAAGGKMAIRFVEEKKPKGIIAVACKKELLEGSRGVRKLPFGKDIPILKIPLLRDGCVDTEVDEEEVLRAIRL